MDVPPRTVAGIVTLVLTATSWTGCTHENDGAGDRGTPMPSATAESGAASASSPTPTRAPDELEVTPASYPYGKRGAPTLLRARDGTTIVVFEPDQGSQQTSYRLYDNRWRPRTPLLRVDAELVVLQGTAKGFVGRAFRYRRDGSTELAEWVTIDPKGQVEPVADQPDRSTPARRLRPGDLDLQVLNGAPFGYRPADDSVTKKPQPPWGGNGYVVDVDTDGSTCALRPGPLSTGTIHVSTDEGRPVTELTVAGVVPADSGPRLQYCDVNEERILVETGGENPLWLHTLDLEGRYLSSQRLGGLLDPYLWYLLPDGRLVTGTNRPGLMAATDASNEAMEFRRGPIQRDVGFDVLGDEILVLRGDAVHASEDAGVTWREYDLAMP
ncbi:hypothetical protein [Nocardioides bizhenqiangii]|uniref:Lipoprotein n=1 Tax=Nocardioides bizhenqiangii TaxID=3095076 RepID=A0ABZ0ZM34_9ACTN|nr:hypothetical protein [Nocardioides sp. HM61]WQQ25312.1 hypothetical protein SHK19_15235 [Nocardioides sp. HM61]